MWMFHTKESNNRTNCLCETDKSTSIQLRNLQYLLIKIYTIKNETVSTHHNGIKHLHQNAS